MCGFWKKNPLYWDFIHNFEHKYVQEFLMWVNRKENKKICLRDISMTLFYIHGLDLDFEK